MGSRGVHLALTDEESRRLLAADGNEAVAAVLEEIEKRRDTAWLAESDAWDPVHRSLSNGTLYYDEGEYPLNRAVLGGQHLYDGDDAVIAYVPPHEVKDVAAALAPITVDAFRRRYDDIDPDDYEGEHGQEDFDRAWSGFERVRDFYKKAAADGRAVVFTVDP